MNSHQRSNNTTYYNALNVHSTAARYNSLLSKRSIILSVCCLAIVLYEIPRLLFGGINGQILRGELISASIKKRKRNRCWLKTAMASGELKLFSHRSNTQSTDQPTSCHDALVKLKEMNVNHLDLDLVLDTRHGAKKLVVAHPMEYKQQSRYYSPCANTDFDTMIQTLKQVYGSSDKGFFISMEPKAAWGNSAQEVEDVALVNTPSTILEVLLEKIKQNELKHHCAAIVELKKHAHDTEEVAKQKTLLKEILQHCQFYRGIRLADESPTSMGEYDMLMPTIEFHPAHPHNTAKKDIPKSIRSKSIFWVVDSEADLALAAELHPYGIVSNSPKNIVDIVKGPGWCDE